MIGHTPGPWVWVGRYLVPASAAGEEYPALFAIADDGSAFGEYTATLVPGSSDGRLIASAPELLAALERIAREHDCGCVPCVGSCRSKEALEITVEEIQEIARAAIAKAQAS